MKYAPELLVLTGMGTGAPAAFAQLTRVGVVAWVEATTLPSTPTRLIE
jgi:hypothetical protein